VNGVIFDTGALIALDRGVRAVGVLVDQARRTQRTITVPAPVVAQAWRDPPRQARLAAFLRLPNVDVIKLDGQEARLVGLLLARARRSDVVDAHVAVCAIRLRQTVVTSDPNDLHRLAPGIEVYRV
jgi:hypothetical protein